MDSIDSQILKALKSDGRKPFVEIAKETGLTEGAIRARIKKLTSSGIIKKFTVDTSETVSAIVMVATSKSVTSDVAGAIKKLGINEVYEVSGNFDIICFITAETMDKVNSMIDAIRALEGVADTSTNMVLK
jgi:Lrp/AsnC family transcriptional regulator of lysine biosynthesis